MTGQAAIVAVILTFNEAQHLPAALASLRSLTDRVLVLDSGSTDGTLEIARAAGSEVHTRPFDGYANQRNAALALAGDTEWVFFLDADERLTPGGVVEIQAAIADAPMAVAGFWLPRLNLFFGRALRGGGWWPDRQARLLRQGRASYDPSRQVHEVVVFDGETCDLHVPLIHDNYATRAEFVRKQRAFTAQRIVQQVGELPPRRRAYLGAPVRQFWRRVVRLRGYRDGLTGLFLAIVLGAEEWRAVRMLRTRERSR